ncbi:hypothetical protein FUSO4_06380 [Fusobacterium necrophorum DJ-1]|uniref:HTH gntR-type domain-containing protein n=3 Tax=Fusobacterium necrophorum TaxID=859 RepID=A0AB73C161_9FUSO|nr:hypothetical protein FUSO5_07635 [Fusobacterium necrophorum BFTR-1]KDE65544.1 hypothetical protein FUSO4_06380 [Fusobacterium necrophorum DJ-1]KDE70113.1 hypothetical protein FUSO8_09820 [Fusobacterium necrophorum DJ-2]MBR8822117.1 HTH-type transcriptional repressor GamR [Fusobacterium necrophorum]
MTMKKILCLPSKKMKIKEISPYEKVKEELLYYISENNLQNNDRLAAERELSNKWNVNRETVRRAIYSLILEEKLYSIRGSGNYIKKEKYNRNLVDLESLSSWAKNQNLTLTSEVIFSKIIEANKKISQKLHVLLGTKIFNLVRCRILNGEAITIEYSYIPYLKVEGIEKYDLKKNSLYQILNSKYSITLKDGEESIGITYIDNFESQYLKSGEGSPALFTTSTVYDMNGSPIEYCKTVTQYNKLLFSFSGSIKK